ncbi:Ribonuclease H-like domain containing protein, partial [Parasponia andersonii]
WHEFTGFHCPTTTTSLAPITKRDYKWKPLERDCLKLNIDASTISGFRRIGIGAVIRDHRGRVAMAKKMIGPFTAFIAECHALRVGIRFCEQSNLKISAIETDALNVAAAVHSFSPLSEESSILSDVKHLLQSFSNVGVNFIPIESPIARVAF